MLVTSFLPDPDKGKIWVIPEKDPAGGYELVGGLQAPTGICFDVNHDFLYVVDKDEASDTNGFIYQLEIEWDED